jgi:hypothetical protein
MESVKYGLGYEHATPLKDPSSMTQSKRLDNIYLEDDDDHQGETRKMDKFRES